MSLANLGNIGELVGAVGVIASLIYLATQIRSARSVALSQNVREIFDGLRRTQILIASDPDLTRIWQQGHTDLDALPQDERLRFSMLLGDYILMYREAQIANREGMLTGQDYQRLRGFVAMLLNSPGGNQLWETHLQGLYSEDISEELNAVRGSLPDILTL